MCVRAWQTPCPTPSPPPHMHVGKITDAHHCHITAGYFYCAALDSCTPRRAETNSRAEDITTRVEEDSLPGIRPFETPCPHNGTAASRDDASPPRSRVFVYGAALGLCAALGLLVAFYSGRCAWRRKVRRRQEQEFRKQFDKVEMVSLADAETKEAEFV